MQDRSFLHDSFINTAGFRNISLNWLLLNIHYSCRALMICCLLCNTVKCSFPSQSFCFTLSKCIMKAKPWKYVPKLKVYSMNFTQKHFTYLSVSLCVCVHMCLYMCMFVFRGFEVPAGPWGGENCQDETTAGEDQKGLGWCQKTGLFVCARVFVSVSHRISYYYV